MTKPKGSTIIIVFMYATWIIYLLFQLYVRTRCGAWLPSEVTYGTAALFIVETVSLARLKLAKEGNVLPEKQTNTFASKLGLANIESFESDAQKISKENQQQVSSTSQSTISQVQTTQTQPHTTVATTTTTAQTKPQTQYTGTASASSATQTTKEETCQTNSSVNSQAVSSGSPSQHS